MAKETVTMDRYGHLFSSDDHKAAMDAIAGLPHAANFIQGQPPSPNRPRISRIIAVSNIAYPGANAEIQRQLSF